MPPRGSAEKPAVCKAAIILYLLSDFLGIFHVKWAESGRGVGKVRNTHRSASFPIRSWFLTTYKCPSQPFTINHGRRYVFSQPVLDHICIGNASHLEHSRPGANGRRVTPAVDTTTWHSETTSLPQSRSSIAQTRKKRVDTRDTLWCLRLLPTVTVCDTVALLSTNAALRHSHHNSTSTTLLNFLPVIIAGRFQPFTHPFTLCDSHIH